MLARIWGVERRRQEFTEFCTSAKDDCLRVVLVSVGDRQLAEDLVAEAFTLRVFFDLDTGTTAKTLGISPETVGVHLHRALAALRAQIPSSGDQEAGI